nr:trna modification gtpase mss1, mitochondrial [Quercus suber]
MTRVGASCRLAIAQLTLGFARHRSFVHAGRLPATKTTAPGLNGNQDPRCVLESRSGGNSVRHFATSASPDSTIYALSTASGRAAIAVIRVSGPACLEIYQNLCPGKKHPEARRAVVRTLFEPGRSAALDNVLDSNALILHFPGPTSATGEDVLELHVHGGPAIVKAVLFAISRCGSSSTGQIRYADPGEFTRRAFLNERLDLTQVEALGDTLAATTEQQRKLSVRGTASKLAKSYDSWRQDLLYARGELEALIDFSEDQHFDESPSQLCASVALQVRSLMSKLRVHSQNAVRGELLRHGISIALLGAPNAGKSSLLNRIVGREAAIVSEEAGTTRDVVEVGLDLGGYLCRIGDTAGLRKAKEELRGQTQDASVQQRIGEIEKEGMRRAKARAVESDVVVVVLSLEPSDSAGSHMTQLHLDSEVVSTASRLVREKDNVLVVVNKVDLLAANMHVSSPTVAKRGTHVASLTAGSGGVVDTAGFAEQIMHHLPGLLPSRIHMITCKDPLPDVSLDSANPKPYTPSDRGGAGLQAFLQSLIAEFRRLTTALSPSSVDSREPGSHPGRSIVDLGLGFGLSDPDPSVWQESLGASERHRLLLDECCEALARFLAEVGPPVQDESDSGPPEADIVVAAEHLRAAAECLAKITGKGQGGDVEEVLGVVFEKFCVGK